MFRKFMRSGWYFDANATGAGAGAGGSGAAQTPPPPPDGGQNGGAGGTTEPLVFDNWIKDQPEAVKTMITAYETGLKNTVTATRQERDTLAGQIKDLLPKAEKGSELEKSLVKIQSDLDAANKRATFAEEAIKVEVGCLNVVAAFAVATTQDLFDKRGNPDWTAIKAAAPQLFGTKVPDGNGGEGANSGGTGKTSMDDLIRARVR